MLLELKEYELEHLSPDIKNALSQKCIRELTPVDVDNFDSDQRMVECISKKISEFADDIKSCGKYTRMFKFTEKMRALVHTVEDSVIFLEDPDKNELILIYGFERIYSNLMFKSKVDVYFITPDFLYNFLEGYLL